MRKHVTQVWRIGDYVLMTRYIGDFHYAPDDYEVKPQELDGVYYFGLPSVDPVIARNKDDVMHVSFESKEITSTTT
jgi:hypothetical protein